MRTVPWDPNLPRNLRFAEFDRDMNNALRLSSNTNAEVTLRKRHLQLLVGLGKKLFMSMRLVWLEKCPTLKPYTSLLSPTNKCVLCIDVLHSYIY